MEIKRVVTVYFSPTGATKKAVLAFAAGTGLPVEEIDLTLPKNRKGFTRAFTKNELLIAALPVYAGRLPMYLDDFFDGLKSDGTPAVAAVSFGNREYDDAIIELTMGLEKCGFSVKAAATFIGQHNFSSKIATGRLDAGDIATIIDFGKRTAQSLMSGASGALNFKGTYPYTASGYDPAIPGPNPTRPPVLTGSECNGCGLCADTCPWSSIDNRDFKTINHDKCFRCFHCVKICPAHAKKVTDEKWLAFLPTFEAKLNATRKEPELFLPLHY
ncbi:MAG TPA: 4Fe-4S dicluster domain-containing protein [Bacillota bacterium]|nr:4Fe-4S dicluster domain-containing protein [Bacillota bacterium]